MFGKLKKRPDRTEETELSKGSVMTVQVHPVETETDLKTERRVPVAERKQGDHNPINLWDEHANVKDMVRIRDRPKGD